MADYSTSTPLTTNTGLVYGLVGVSNTNNPILFDPNSIGSRTLTFTAPTGFSVVGSPLTGTGTISLGFSAGYSLPTTASQTNWDTAFGWGDHAAVGYLTSFTETDPVFSAAPASGITAGDISNWNSAYGWGDHAVAGYLDAADIGLTVLAYDANLQAFTTAFTLPTTDGTAGQVLGTDGAGNLTFTFPAPGPVQSVTYNDGGTSTIDAADGGNSIFTLTANGASTTIAVSNVPTTGTRYGFELHLTWSSGAITWPASWTNGMNAPSATGNYIISGITIDGGTNYTIGVIYK